MNIRFTAALAIVFLCISSPFSLKAYGEEKEPCLSNIQQLTHPGMGFEKAGEAYFSPDGEKIAFQAIPFGSEHYQIFLKDLKTGSLQMISTGKGACTCAYFHPTEEKILFASSHEDPFLLASDEQMKKSGYQREGSQYAWDFTRYMNIYEAHLDGSGLKALTHGAFYHAECAYSPDGNRIVFASDMDGSMNIYTMNRDGSDLFQVTHGVNCYNGGPFYSPDGKSIIYRSDREKANMLDIYLIDINATNDRRVTDNGAINWAPYWHPSGKYIAFTTSLHGHHQYEVYLLNFETLSCHRVTHSPGFDGLPVFSPDGKKLMWTSKRGPDKTCQVFIADFKCPF